MSDLQLVQPVDAAPLAPTALPFDQHPVAVYLASLTSARSRRVLAGDLRAIAALLTGVDPRQSRQVDVFQLDWAALRYSHTAAIRARLAELYSPSTVNRQLSALRGVLKEAWRLGQMSAEDYRRACDIHNVKGSSVTRQGDCIKIGLDR